MTVPLRTNVEGGLISGATTGTTIVVPVSDKFMRVVGFRLQIYDVTSAGLVELIGKSGTKVSAPVYVDNNGLNYVQDRIRVEMGKNEILRLSNATDGKVRWAVFFEEEASVE